MTKNTYTLPCNEDLIQRIVSDPKAHFGHFKEAIDFVVPEGTEILAVRDGEVVDVVDGFSEGGNNPGLATKVNYITLKHEGEEYSQYAHLKHKGCLVNVGDKVKKGQVIALSGNTGYSTEPHIHFHVFKLNSTDQGWESLEVKFDKTIKIKRK